MAWNRALSLAAYLIGAALIDEARGGVPARLFLITQAVVLVFIWFADFFGAWIGPPPFSGGRSAKVIDRESPAWLVAAFGWLIMVGVFVLSYVEW